MKNWNSYSVVGWVVGVAICGMWTTAEAGDTEPANAAGAAAQAEVVGKPGAWKLMRRGEEYVIRGAGGTTDLKLLKEMGGNSIRTWSADSAEPLLDEAEQLDISVCVGLGLVPARWGMNYADEAKVDEQIARVVKDVERLKDRSAVLMWGLGNELELAFGGDDRDIWRAVNKTAKAVRAADPSRPTAVIVANVGTDKARKIKELCPDVQILGINAYGDLTSIPERLKEQGWDKPYVVTEFGPRGHWEVNKSAWGAPLEPTSTEKAATYRAGYAKTVSGQPGWCLGAYAFLWGQKQERTPTWYGLLLQSGERTPATDVLSEEWTGKRPENSSPTIKPIVLDPASMTLKAGARVVASVVAEDPNADVLKYEWFVMRESTERTVGGDKESIPETIPCAGLEQDSSKVEFVVPREAGNYRLFVIVRDGRGTAAAANVPVKVESTK